MATKKTPAGRQPSTGSPRSAEASNDEFRLPAEPEVTSRPTSVKPTPNAASNPGREPAPLAAARARRERSYSETPMRRESTQYRSAPCPPRSSSLSGGLKLIGGAGLGAVIMYLLDPEAGDQRRAEWGDKASRAASSTGNVLGNVWDLSTDAGRALAERAAEMGAAGTAAASHFGSNFADNASDSAHRFQKGAHRQMKGARHTASGWFGREEERSYVPETSTVVSAVTALAAGVGLMYLLDPTDGPRRRNVLLGKATRCLNETGDFFRRTGRHVANRSRGAAHDTRAMLRPADEATDRTIAERIRARLGHLQQPSANVNVVVIDGCATITGRCTPDDVDALLSTVQSTPGVASIVNLLTVENPGASSSITTM